MNFCDPCKNNEEIRSIPSTLVNPGKIAKLSNDKLPLKRSLSPEFFLTKVRLLDWRIFREKKKSMFFVKKRTWGKKGIRILKNNNMCVLGHNFMFYSCTFTYLWKQVHTEWCANSYMSTCCKCLNCQRVYKVKLVIWYDRLCLHLDGKIFSLFKLPGI